MSKLKILILLFAVAFLPEYLQAQKFGKDLTTLTLVTPPKQYLTPSGALAPPKTKDRQTDKFWVVYSDRDNNYSYFDKLCSESQKNIALSFMESFVVAEEDGDALRLVRYDPANEPFESKPGKKEYQFKKSAVGEEVGWVKMKNLLLWKTALVDDSTKYTIKAVSVKKLENKEDVGRFIKKGILDLYNYPDPTKPKNGNDITLFQYFFVYKKDIEKKMVLVSKSYRVSQSEITENMIGWAPENQLHIWDNAICLRANFDQEAIERRVEKKIELKFFSCIDDAKKFSAGINDPKEYKCPMPFYYDPIGKVEGKSDNPYLYGFPIIGKAGSEKSTTIFKTGYVTNTLNKDGVSIFNSARQAEFNKKFSDRKKEARKVNVVFVIDGYYRNNLGPQKSYIKTTAQALNGIAYIESEDEITKNNYKMGAIIYNDPSWAEEPFKEITLRTNKDDFLNKLYAEGEKTGLSKLDRKANGAPLYEAIIKGCNLFEKADQTNIIIVIGSTTNSNNINKQAALEKLMKTQSRMYFFQVENTTGQYFDEFRRDSRFFLTKAAEDFDKKYYADEIKKGKLNKAEVKATTSTDFTLENSGLTGMVSLKEENDFFKPEEMKRKIQTLFRKNEDRMNKIWSLYDTKTSGVESNLTEEDEGEAKALRAMLSEKGITSEELDQLVTNDNYQVFFEAYTSTINKGLEEPLLKRTLFMSRSEFQRIRDIVSGLIDDNWTTDELRIQLESAIKEVVLKYKGGNFKATDLASKNLDYYWSLITSLPETGNPIFKRKLTDYKDSKKVPDDQIIKVKNAFIKVTSNLKKISNNPLYKISQYDDDFYWVPEDAFHPEI